MTWRRVNAVVAIACSLILFGTVALWIAAWVRDFIGDTRFIGHVSMAALVLGAGGMALAGVAAWRADVPDDE